jgi:hypothetical protein
MSVLLQNIRPLVTFDVENAEHRRFYAEFIKYRTWGRCPVRFMSENLDENLANYLSEQLAAYYVRLEFENEKAKTSLKNRAKPSAESTPGSVRTKFTVQTQSRREQDTVSA